MKSYVEHANITVTNLKDTIAFLTTAMPDFKVRGGGEGEFYDWCHLGSDDSYIALQEVVIDKKVERIPYRQLGVNHIGFVVENADATRERLLEAGYQQVPQEAGHPWRKRYYFLDKDGVEWEFIEYMSDIPSERNDCNI